MSRVLRVFALLSLFGAFAVLRPTVAPALLLPQDIAPYHIQEYWYLPTFYPSVNEAVSALIGIQTKVVQWQGGWVEWTISTPFFRSALRQ
ncbi:MAG TPA: hypothetical protein P5541_08625 [Thermovirgaceae bacterium]|nr:hypothetical protein [Thermovirgaceae bacterium]